MNINPKRILVIQHKQIGDVILTTPVVRVVKERYPDAKVYFLTESFCAPILEGNPHLEGIISFDPKELKGLLSQFKFYLSIRKMKFDLILDFYENPRSALICALSGAKLTVSYEHPTRGWLYKRTVKPRGGYAIDYKLSMLEGIGIKSGDNYPEVAVPESAQRYIDDYLDSIGVAADDFIICMDSSHKRTTRRWTKEGFAALIDLLVENHNAKVILTWGPGEHDKVDEVRQLAKHECYLSPETGLKELTALIKRSHIIIGNDSAPRHLAVSQGVPTLAIAGSTSDGWLHPDPIHRVVRKGYACQPCKNRETCEYDIKCMKELTADEVFAALGEFPDVSETLKRFLARPAAKREVTG